MKKPRKSVVTGVEMFRKLLDSLKLATTWCYCFVVLNVKTSSVVKFLLSQVLLIRTLNSKAEIYVLSKEEGGRHTPFFNRYRPQFYFRTTDVTGDINLPEGTEMVMPGDNITVTVELIAPIAMEKGTRFAIREGGRTVGAGAVAIHHEVIKPNAFQRGRAFGLVLF